MTKDIFGLKTVGATEKAGLIRKDLHNLTTSYADEADVFTELIQNAVDAIERRVSEDGGGVGTVTVVVGKRNQGDHYVYVQDDGFGMSEKIADKAFIPGFSEGKRQGSTLGYKGVGMSYVIAVSNHIALRTVDGSGGETERTVLRTNDWVRDDEKPFPEVTEVFEAPDVVQKLASEITRGTGVYFAFHSYSKPGTLDNLVLVGDGPEAEIEYWAAFLAARSALGVALTKGKSPNTEVTIKLLVDRGDGMQEREFARGHYDIGNGELGYPFPYSVFRVGSDISDIDKTPEAKRVVQHGHKYQAVYHEWTGQELIEELGSELDEEEKTLLLGHLDFVSGWLCYSTQVLQQVKTLMGTRSPAVRWGARLAVDGAPQGRPMALKLTSDAGLDRQTHIVVGMSEVDLDTGRKFVSDEHVQVAIDKVTTRVVTKLKAYRWALKTKERAPVAEDLKEWIEKVDVRQGGSIIPHLFELYELTPPTRVNPMEEQEVISLWTALIAGKFLDGFAMRAISGYRRYDCLVNLTEAAVAADGLLAPISTQTQAKLNAVLEFKINFGDLIVDFEAEVKISSELDLVVCWDCGELSSSHGILRPTYGQWSDERTIRAASYTYTDTTSVATFPVLALRNIVAELLAEQGKATGLQELEVLQARDAEQLV